MRHVTVGFNIAFLGLSVLLTGLVRRQKSSKADFNLRLIRQNLILACAIVDASNLALHFWGVRADVMVQCCILIGAVVCLRSSEVKDESKA